MRLGRTAWLVAGTWFAAIGLLWPLHGVLLDVDEVDYLRAARLGVVANALERGSLSPGEFVRFGEAKLSRRPPLLPAGYAEERDPLVLRHYHPPFVIYLLSAVAQAQNERVLRIVQLVGALAFCGTVLLVALRGGGPGVGWTEALVVSLLALQLARTAFSSISFHGWEAVWILGAGGLLARWLQSPETGTAISFCVVGALALATLPSGIVVWPAAAACLLFHSARLRAGRRQFGLVVRRFLIGLGISGVIVLMIWPGSIVQLSIPKSWALHAYRLVKGT